MEKTELMELIASLPPHEGNTFEEALVDHLIASGVIIQRWILIEDRLPTREDADCDGYIFAVPKYGATIPCCWDNVAEHPERYTHWVAMPEVPNANKRNCGWCKHYKRALGGNVCRCKRSVNCGARVSYWGNCNCFEWNDD